jgi:hypothetical protein
VFESTVAGLPFKGDRAGEGLLLRDAGGRRYARDAEG